MEKMRVDLCGDHFDRLLRNDACSNCPSKIENEEVVKALAAGMATTETDRFRSILSELKSIRRSQNDLSEKVDALEHKVYGNGNKGLLERLTVMETTYRTSSKSYGNAIAIGVAVLSAIISLVAAIR